VLEQHDGTIAASDVPAGLRRVGDRLAVYSSSVGLERWARLGATAMVPVLLSESGRRALLPLLAGLSGYVLLTALIRRGRYLRAADLVVAAVVIALAGSAVLPFLPFLMVSVAAPAAQGGLRSGLAAAGTLSSVLLVRLATAGDVLEVGVGQVLPLVTLLVLTAITTAVAADILADRSVQGRLVLQQANRLLSSLRSIADHLPGGLDASTVSAAVVAEVRDIRGTTAVVVLAEDHGVLRPAAATGLEPSGTATLRVDEVRTLLTEPGLTPLSRFPRTLRSMLDLPSQWSLHPLGPLDSLRGVLLVGFVDRAHALAARTRLASVAADGGLALENARLFDGTRISAADAARQHVAADLHDGVAQSLAHLRMELELMAMVDAQGQDGEIARLSRVAATALTDLRDTIAGLRRLPEGDLPTLLARYLDDVRTPHGPKLRLECDTTVQLGQDRTEQLLLIVQEAVSNALRHAQAKHVVVSLVPEGAHLRLQIEDDGVGRWAPTSRPGGGIGLRSMRDRSELLGGGLEVDDRPGGGTVVTVRFPATVAPSVGRR
jgi:signal transduction histidine kinase